MTHARTVLIVLAAALALMRSAPRAQAPPSQLPLVVAGDLQYLGAFTLPPRDSRGSQLTFGGIGLGLAADGRSLYFGCAPGTAAARVAIPEVGEEAPVLEPCQTIPNLGAINPGDPNPTLLGGVLAWNGRVIVSAYAYYDGGGRAARSHFAGTSLATVQGPYQVGSDPAGVVAGYMGVIPEAWRTLLGGPALTGQCCIPIISRSSYGPSVSVFDPDHVGTRASIASTMLVGYPDAHQGLGPWDAANPYFSGATKMGGIAFPAESRSLLFVGRHGTTYCYGSGTPNQSLHGRPKGDGSNWCYDPTDDSKGNHGYPYRHMVWAYDASDLAAVAQGRAAPWDLRPYATWTLTEMSGGSGHAQIRGAVYAPATRRWYVTIDDSPTVHVYQIGAATGTGPIERCGDAIDNDGDGEIDEGCAAPPPTTPPGGGMPGDGDDDDDDGDEDGDDGDDDSDGDDSGAGDGDGDGDDTNKGTSTRGSWSAPRELAASGVTSASIAACGSTVHVAYGGSAVYYRRSLTEGTAWRDWQQLGDGAVPGARALACDGATVVLAATRGGAASGGGDVWTWRSLDGGASWRMPIKLSASRAVVHVASAVDGAAVTTAWVEQRAPGAGWSLHARRSDDRGETWGAEVVVASAGRGADAPATITLDPRGTLVAWTAGRSTDARRQDGGGWVAAGSLAPAGTAVGAASIAATADAVAAVVVADGATGSELRLVRSGDGGRSWRAVSMLERVPGAGVLPVLAAWDDRLAVAWTARRDGTTASMVRVSRDGGRQWSRGSVVFDGAAAPRAAWTAAALHVVATDARGGLHYARHSPVASAALKR